MINRPVIVCYSVCCLLLGPLLVPASPVQAQPTETERHVLLIGGLGGNAEYASTFQQYLFDARQAFIDQFQVPPANITVLAGSSEGSDDFIDDVSTADNIRAQFDRLAARSDTTDLVFVVLFGHGSFNGEEASLNIPRRDLGDSDFAELLRSVAADRIVFVNTAPSSGPFIEALSARDRIVITATRSGRQRNETIFPRYFVEALSSPSADIDQDNRLSVAEAFRYGAEMTNQWFEENGNVQSEHALLDDTGDGNGARVNELADAGDGNLAAITYFGGSEPSSVAAANTGSDSSAANQARTRQLEEKIAALKSRKNSMNTSEYYDQLEQLLIRLARISQAADSLNQTN